MSYAKCEDLESVSSLRLIGRLGVVNDEVRFHSASAAHCVSYSTSEIPSRGKRPERRPGRETGAGDLVAARWIRTPASAVRAVIAALNAMPSAAWMAPTTLSGAERDGLRDQQQRRARDAR